MTVVSTLHFPRRAAWADRVRMLDRTSMSRTALLRELLRSTTGDVVVLDGGIGVRDGYVDRVAAALLARRRTPPRVVITDSTWTPGPARRAVLRAWDTPRTTYCVLSEQERDRFPASWGVDPERVAVTPFYWTLPEDAPEAAPGGTGIFAGGDSLRDHATLLAAVADLDVPTVVASRSKAPAPVPAHVAFGPVEPDRFTELLRASAVVVVPLLPGLRRSAGQQTYLNGMVLGKPVVVSDVPGAREHVVDGETGLLVPPGDAAALAEALRWVLDPANADAVARMGARAREAVLTEAAPDRYVERLLDVVDGLPA